MTQDQWIQCVSAELRAGPLRFHYRAMRLVYILHDFGHTYGGYHSPGYSLKIEDGRTGRMIQSSSYGSSGLAKIVQEHPLDRFEPERPLLLEHAMLLPRVEQAMHQLEEKSRSQHEQTSSEPVV